MLYLRARAWAVRMHTAPFTTHRLFSRRKGSVSAVSPSAATTSIVKWLCFTTLSQSTRDSCASCMTMHMKQSNLRHQTRGSAASSRPPHAATVFSAVKQSPPTTQLDVPSRGLGHSRLERSRRRPLFNQRGGWQGSSVHYRTYLQPPSVRCHCQALLTPVSEYLRLHVT